MRDIDDIDVEETIEEEEKKDTISVPDIVFFIQNQLRNIHPIFDTHKEELTTSYLDKQVIENISKKIVLCATVYELAVDFGLEHKESLELAALPLYPELSKAYMSKGFKGFLAKVLRGFAGSEAEEFEGERRWFFPKK